MFGGSSYILEGVDFVSFVSFVKDIVEYRGGYTDDNSRVLAFFFLRNVVIKHIFSCKRKRCGKLRVGF